jgi:hypothetical protein
MNICQLTPLVLSLLQHSISKAHFYFTSFGSQIKIAFNRLCFDLAVFYIKIIQGTNWKLSSKNAKKNISKHNF